MVLDTQSGDVKVKCLLVYTGCCTPLNTPQTLQPVASMFYFVSVLKMKTIKESVKSVIVVK